MFVQQGISGVKSREDLVMSNTDLSTIDPFSAAPFKMPAGKQKQKSNQKNDSDGSLSSNEGQGMKWIHKFVIGGLVC